MVSRLNIGVLILLAIDLLMFGSGVELDIFGQSLKLRKFLFAAYAVIVVLFFIKYPRPSLALCFLALSMLFILQTFVLPAFKGISVVDAISDCLPLFASAVVLLKSGVPNRELNWSVAEQIIYVGVLALALIHVVTKLTLELNLMDVDSVRVMLHGLYEDKNFLKESYVFISHYEDSETYRVYFGNSVLLLVGMYFVLERLTKQVSATNCFALSLFITAIYSTGTRSLYLASIILLFFSLTCSDVMSIRRIRLGFVKVLLLLIAPFAVSCFLIFTLNPSVLDTINLERSGTESDDTRIFQLGPLLDQIYSSPLLGSGYGASAEYVRNEALPYSYELSILALLMKIGVLGLLACLACVAGMISRIVPSTVKQVKSIYGLYFAFIIACFYNPYMFGFYGTLFFIILFYEYKRKVHVND
jgi:hypothetical protein